MELYQIILVTVAAANLAVTIWLLRLLLPIWQKLKKVMNAVDDFDFERLTKQFINSEKPLSETVQVKIQENKDEGYKELTVIKTYKRPLGPKEIQENFVRQMAQEMQ